MSAHQAHLPGSPARNGLPERKNYTPRKGAVDQGPHLSAEQLAPYTGGYERWLPQFSRGNNKAPGGDACPDCGCKLGGRACRAACGGTR